MDLCQHASLRCAVRRRLFDLRMRVAVCNPPTGSSHGRPAVVPAKMEARAVQLAQSRDSPAAFHVEFQLDFATMVRAADVAAGVNDQTESVTDPVNIEAQPNFFIQTIPDKTNPTFTIDNSGIGVIKNPAPEQSREDRQSWYGGHEYRRRLLHD